MSVRITLAGVLLGLACSIAGATERHVDPANAAAADMGEGSITAPFRSLKYAMSRLQPGDHLVIAAGTYRDALVFPERNWGTANTVVEGQGTVLVKGSDLVDGWKPLGQGRYVREWPQEAAQVYAGGKPLQQIGGTLFDGYPEKAGHPLQALHRSQGGIWPGRKAGDESSLPPGSFYYNADRKSLFIRLFAESDAPERIEVSTRPYLMFGKGLSNVTVRNLAFAHGNTSPKIRGGLVTLMGNKITVDTIGVSLADSIGIHLAGDDITMSHSSANACGQLGLSARGRRMRLVDNETSGNNTRGFNKWWEAGGAKFVGDGGLQDSVVSGHKAFANNGDGIWFDWKNHNNRLENSIAAYNTGMGIQYEASTGAVITGNVVVGNAQRGIYLPHSSDSEISRNVVAANGMQGIVIMDEGAKDPQGTTDFRPRANRVFGNVVAWNVAALYFPAELSDNRSDSNFYLGSAQQNRFSLGWPRRGSDRLPEWVDHTGQDRHSRSVEALPDAAFMESVAKRSRNPDLEWVKSSGASATLRTQTAGLADPGASR